MTPADEALLDDLPDAGLLPGLAYRVGLKRTARAWGRRFVLRDPFLSSMQGWLIRNGRHERPETTLALRYVDPTLPVIEIGGGLGVVSCVVNGLLEDPAKHVVVEMDPRAAAVLRRNAALNRSGFEVVEAAIAYGQDGAMSGTNGPFDGANRLVKGGTGSRPASRRTLRQLADERGWPRFNLVMDIEGMELEILTHEADILRDRVAVLVLELHPGLGTHSSEAAAAIGRIEALGLRLVDWMGHTMAFVAQGERPAAGKRRAAPVPAR